MKKVLIYAGTTEGRMLAEQLAAEHIPCHVCVATAYGQLVMPKMDGVEVTTGRLDIARMRQHSFRQIFRCMPWSVKRQPWN